ncbi:MAG: hypothetical protein K2I72_01985, partial [Bacilli bacterium]|nr:hypothetical protein [Bacilli bacterium]
MDELVMNEDFTVNEFLDYMLDNKNKSGRDVVGNINGFSVSTEGCTTRSQLQNKLASEMHNYISKVRNTHPTKRQLDGMVLILDESLAPRADWDDPKDVLEWINLASTKLNNPEFATTVYEDGKTTAEIMLERLKEHGYGQISGNLSEAEKEINAKMSDLENYGFLMTDFFSGEVATQEHEVENQVVEPNSSQVQEPSNIDPSFVVTNDKTASDSFQTALTPEEIDLALQGYNNQTIPQTDEITEDDFQDENSMGEEDLGVEEIEEISEELPFSQEETPNDEDLKNNSEQQISDVEQELRRVEQEKSAVEQKDKDSVGIQESLAKYPTKEDYAKKDQRNAFFAKRDKKLQELKREDFFTYKGDQKSTSPSDFFTKKDKNDKKSQELKP